MHHSYKQMNQVEYFVRSCVGWNVKNKPQKHQTTYKTSYIGQNKNL